MSDLLRQLRSRAEANAKRYVDLCLEELPECAAAARDSRKHQEMLDFAVFTRTRTVELGAEGGPLTADDLAVVESMGLRRGEDGMSFETVRRLLTLHTTATLREIGEASGPRDMDAGMRLLGWLSPQMAVAQRVYTLGYTTGVRRHLPILARVRRFAELALEADPDAPVCADSCGIRLPDRYLVIVVRPSAPPVAPSDLVHAAWDRHGIPATWREPDEFVALVPAGEREVAGALIREVAEIAGQPCSVGVATGPPGTLDEAFALAVRISRVTPAERSPSHLHTVGDVFLELGAAELPEIGSWLHDLARLLDGGPDLVSTLDAYYRYDLSRPRAAASLHIHARTLDFRLRRIRELTGIDPGTAHGIRVLSTVVSWAAAGR
ncbi:helix-turn-helix domain-containing protein [Amycolatopsis oliviviridis]|uniref:Transcriptional regulator n=1 Tax=Amycolatopsis oliviviridis TaxID=1471590 RepID=A0ABQ3L4X4_9PSEU|nr:helix-turn-helix domain-containing protein [Amycolatopsis oliviviridis]GHH00906.1 transcriptional regulator [Amycolatopsis oliviviridis]